MKKWSFDYEGSKIEIINAFKGEKLIVNGALQDEQMGIAHRSRLYGSLKTVNGQDQKIKVSIGGWISINCIVFIDNKEVFRS